VFRKREAATGKSIEKIITVARVGDMLPIGCFLKLVVAKMGSGNYVVHFWLLRWLSVAGSALDDRHFGYFSHVVGDVSLKKFSNPEKYECQCQQGAIICSAHKTQDKSETGIDKWRDSCDYFLRVNWSRFRFSQSAARWCLKQKLCFDHVVVCSY